MRLCNDCLDSGWLLHIIMSNGAQGVVSPKDDGQVPVNVLKTWLTCQCEIGKTRVLDKS